MPPEIALTLISGLAPSKGRITYINIGLFQRDFFLKQEPPIFDGQNVVFFVLVHFFLKVTIVAGTWQFLKQKTHGS